MTVNVVIGVIESFGSVFIQKYITRHYEISFNTQKQMFLENKRQSYNEYY